MDEDRNAGGRRGTSGRRGVLGRRRVLQGLAGTGAVLGAGVGRTAAQDDEYAWEEATEDAYWYGRFNAESLVLSGSGVGYPRSAGGRRRFEDLVDEMEDEAGVEERPIRGLESFTVAPYESGDPGFTERPVYQPRPIQSTLRWQDAPETTLTPESVAWSCLAYSQWSLGFEDVGGPEQSDVADFYAQLYGQSAQFGVRYAYVEEAVLRDEPREEDETYDAGDDDDDREDDDELFLRLAFDPTSGARVRGTQESDRPTDYAATLWSLAGVTAFAEESSVGYDTPASQVDVEELQDLADATARTIVDEISGGEILRKGTIRDLGVMLSAVGSYGPQAGDGDVVDEVEEYADSLRGFVVDNLDADGRVGTAAPGANQAAIQGAVGQGLLWAAEGLGVDGEDVAEDVLDYLIDDLWLFGAGTFDDGRDERRIAVTVRDAGDVVGGLNAASDLLDREDVEDDVFPEFFNNTVNRARLQRAERTESRDGDEKFRLPLPANAGSDFGQAPVFNGAVVYDPPTDEWRVTEDAFPTGDAMYAANQVSWIGQFEGDAFPGRGVP